LQSGVHVDSHLTYQELKDRHTKNNHSSRR